MTTALQEEVSRVRLLAHMLVIGRNKAGRGNSIGASLSSQRFTVRGSLSYVPVMQLSYVKNFKDKEIIRDMKDRARLSS